MAAACPLLFLAEVALMQRAAGPLSLLADVAVLRREAAAKRVQPPLNNINSPRGSPSTTQSQGTAATPATTPLKTQGPAPPHWDTTDVTPVEMIPPLHFSRILTILAHAADAELNPASVAIQHQSAPPQRVLRSATGKAAVVANSIPEGDGSGVDAKLALTPASRGAPETATKENIPPEERAMAAPPISATEVDATDVDIAEGPLTPPDEAPLQLQSAEGAQALEGAAVAKGTKRVRKYSRRLLDAREHQASSVSSARANRKGRKGRK